MDNPNSAFDAGMAIARALEEAGIDYALGGALAYGVWGIPRGTLDVDINVFVADDQGLGRVINVLHSLGGEVDEDGAKRRARDDGMFEAYWGEIRIDVFTPSIDFSWEAARTKVRTQFQDKEAWFLSAEALAVFKLLFFRPKDLVDLERMVEVRRGQLDVGYVRTKIVEMLGEDDERVVRWDQLTA